ncbi:hypothetical protein GINT2_000894 [Glugoides intestinalis]
MYKRIALSKEDLNLVVAFTSENKYIGYMGDLPWKRSLKGDINYINKLIRSETNVALIVGRKTYESIQRMKNIKFLVVTSSLISVENIKAVKSLKEAVEYARENGMYTVVFGGAKIYEEALEKWNCKLFCTIVEEGDLKGDKKFPNYRMKLEDVSKEAEAFLIENNVEKTWNFKENSFSEERYSYKFYVGKWKPGVF